MSHEFDKLKDCPFCGNKPGRNQVEQIRWANTATVPNRNKYQVICWNCNATAGAHLYSEDAVQAWNQRPYDYDMPAIVKKVQRMEAAVNQAITDCVPLLSWINDDDTAVEMVEHLSELLGGALCKQPE